jgi:exonuclease III
MPARRLKVAFWNVENLFDPANKAGRGPIDAQELDAKIQRLADCVNAFFGDQQPPDLLGLAEINTEALFYQLRQKLKGNFCFSWWEHAGKRTQTGLGVLARAPVKSLIHVDTQRPSFGSRPRCLVMRGVLENEREFLLCLNHWKSQMPSPGAGAAEDDEDRKESALWLRQTLENAPEGCAIIVGDFNAEPNEFYFNDSHLPCYYHFSKVLRGRLEGFYNASWRYLTEPLYWEDYSARLPEPRPKRTHSGKYVIWDQLIVSREALKGGSLQLLEKSVRYSANTSLNARHNRYGVLTPLRWSYQNEEIEGASDHFPLLAEFEIS